MEDFEILTRFVEEELNIHPDALIEIKKRGNTDEAIEEIISKIHTEKVKPTIITVEYLKSIDISSSQDGVGVIKGEVSEFPSTPSIGASEAPGEAEGEKYDVGVGSEVSKPEVIVQKAKKRVLAEEYEAQIEIDEEKDITNKSFSVGDIEGFVEYFNNRYEKLAKVLRGREHLKDAATIEWIRRSTYRENLRIIGMVNDVRKSKKGNTIVELEDPTGLMPVVILNTDRELVELSRSIVKDEVIGIEGNGGKNNEILIARDIFFPEVPVKRETNRSEDPLALAMISDVHVGSTEFLEEVFLNFIKWLRGDVGTQSQRSLAGRVKYLVVGGDLVDGVGIYPGQEKELLIRDIHEQYEKFTEFIDLVPEYIEMIIIPGNHDATRQAEPQPAIFERFAPKLYEDPRIHMVGNPCHSTLHGVNVLSYHGRSLDDMISAVPELSYSNPEKSMLQLLKKRHLSPIFGGKVPLSPEAYDPFFIEEVPDILHFAHVHTVGVESYRGTTLINSGTFQKQTSFQRRLNMTPDPGRIPTIDLQTHKTTIMRFM
ncbi:MAG: DNA-directed DNA polymerase II small subunit [Candidatus Hydrothermarchaeales archaeon]